jgi:hypothetical protein
LQLTQDQFVATVESGRLATAIINTHAWLDLFL